MTSKINKKSNKNNFTFGKSNWDRSAAEKNIPQSEVIRGMENKVVPLIEVEYTEEDLAIDLSDLYHPQSPYSPEQKVAAAQAYLITGTSLQAQKYCGVKADIIRDWKSKSNWWPDLFETVKKSKNDELEATFTRIMDSALDVVADRLENGDTKVMRDGSLQKVPMGGKETAIILSIMYDKRALLRGDVTSRVEKKGGDAMQLLQSKFEEIAKQLKAEPINNTFEVIEDGTK